MIESLHELLSAKDLREILNEADLHELIMKIGFHSILLENHYYPVQGIKSPAFFQDKREGVSLDYLRSDSRNLERVNRGEISRFIPIPHELVPEVDMEEDFIVYVSPNGKKEPEENK